MSVTSLVTVFSLQGSLETQVLLYSVLFPVPNAKQVFTDE